MKETYDYAKDLGISNKVNEFNSIILENERVLKDFAGNILLPDMTELKDLNGDLAIAMKKVNKKTKGAVRDVIETRKKLNEVENDQNEKNKEGIHNIMNLVQSDIESAVNIILIYLLNGYKLDSIIGDEKKLLILKMKIGTKIEILGNFGKDKFKKEKYLSFQELIYKLNGLAGTDFQTQKTGGAKLHFADGLDRRSRNARGGRYSSKAVRETQI